MKIKEVITIVAWGGFLVALLLPRLFGITHRALDYVFFVCALTIFVSMVIDWKKKS